MSASCTFALPPEVDANRGGPRPDAGVDASHDLDASGPAVDMPPAPVDMLPPVDEGAPPRDMSLLDMAPVDRGPMLDVGAPDEGMPDLPEDMPDLSTGPGERICDGERVDLATDPNHCGACDVVCDSGDGTCINGVCACPWPGGSACGAEGVCQDLLYDPNHCGACDAACGDGHVCTNGSCVCRPGLTLCSGTCTDLLVDPRHCGACDQDCGEGRSCKAGQCRESRSCGIGYTPCRQDDRVACVNDNVDEEGDLYCRPGSPPSFFCGERCAGDELCFEPDDFFTPIQCRPYRPARTCSACPCDECRDNEVCRRQILGVADVTYCVKKP